MLGTIPLYAFGAAAAWHDYHHINITVLVLGLLLVWLIQLMTHYNNEYCDLETDLVTDKPTRISGGSRVLPRRLVPRDAARIASVATLLLSVILAISLVLWMGVGILALAFAAIAILLGWFYSAPPLKLGSRGLGEMTIALVSCFLVPVMSYYLQTSALGLRLLAPSVSVALLTLALTFATELPDFTADKATGKKNIVVRVGIKRARWLFGVHLAAGWLTFVVVVTLYVWQPLGWILVAPSVPLVSVAILSIGHSVGRHMSYVEIMGLATSLLIAYAGVSFTVGFLTS